MCFFFFGGGFWFRHHEPPTPKTVVGITECRVVALVQLYGLFIRLGLSLNQGFSESTKGAGLWHAEKNPRPQLLRSGRKVKRLDLRPRRERAQE